MFDRQAKIAFIVACITLVVSGVGFRAAVGYLNVYLQKEPVELREHFSTISRQLPSWQAVGQDQAIDAAEIEVLGTDIYLSRNYRARDPQSDAHLHLHLAYYTGMIDAIPHVPDRCMGAAGFETVALPAYYDLSIDTSQWQYDSELTHSRSGKPYPKLTYAHPITGRPTAVRLPIGDFRLRTTEFRFPDKPDTRTYAGFFFIANGQVTASPYQVRALAFDRTDKYAYYCKVQFTATGAADLSPDEFVALVSDFLNELLPEIMRCLPDWSEVEAGEHGSV